MAHTCMMTNLPCECACFHSPEEGLNITSPLSPSCRRLSQLTYLNEAKYMVNLPITTRDSAS